MQITDAWVKTDEFFWVTLLIIPIFLTSATPHTEQSAMGSYVITPFINMVSLRLYLLLDNRAKTELQMKINTLRYLINILKIWMTQLQLVHIDTNRDKTVLHQTFHLLLKTTHPQVQIESITEGVCIYDEIETLTWLLEIQQSHKKVLHLIAICLYS